MAKKRQNKPNKPPSGTSRRTAVSPRPPDPVIRTNGRTPKAAISSPSRLGRGPLSRQTVVAGIAAVVVIVIIAVGAFLLTRPNTGSASSPVTSSDLAGVPVADEGRNHVPEGSAITYKTNPPASGPHYPSPKPWGFYSDTVAPGYWVHNLEHGGIVVLYDCPSGCPDVVDQLKQAVDTFPKDKYNEVKLLVTPYSGLPNNAKVMAVAWDFQKSYQTFDLNQVLAFYNDHVDKSPEDVP